MATEKVEEPKVAKRRVAIHGNPMKPDQITGYREVSSGPLPTEADLPSLGGTGEVTIVEGSETESRHSPQFPSVDSKKMKRDFDAAGAPSKGAKID